MSRLLTLPLLYAEQSLDWIFNIQYHKWMTAIISHSFVSTATIFRLSRSVKFITRWKLGFWIKWSFEALVWSVKLFWYVCYLQCLHGKVGTLWKNGKTERHQCRLYNLLDTCWAIQFAYVSIYGFVINTCVLLLPEEQGSWNFMGNICNLKFWNCDV